jgi:hypothetical protein
MDYKKKCMNMNTQEGYTDYYKNNMSTDMENVRGNKRARVTRGSRNPKHSKKEALHCAINLAC